MKKIEERVEKEKTMTTKGKIINTASKEHGGFVDTDGAWCMTSSPEQFKTFLENTFGFEVLECKSTNYSTAVAFTADGLQIAWNGYCKQL